MTGATRGVISEQQSAAVSPESSKAQAPVTADFNADFLPARALRWFDAHRKLLLIGVVVVYALGFNGQWRVDPDSALYLTIGRNLAQGQGYTYHGQPHDLVYPGLPWLFAGLFKLFGTSSLLPAITVMFAFSFITLGLTYRLFALHAGRATAVLMLIVLAASRGFYRYSFELMSDLPFLMGVMGLLVGLESIRRRFEKELTDAFDVSPRARPRWFDWIALLLGGAIVVVTRPTMWAVILAVLVALVLWSIRRPLRWARLAAIVLLIAGGCATVVWFVSLTKPLTYENAVAQAMRDPSHLFHRLADNVPRILQPNAAEAILGLDIGTLNIGNASIPVAAFPSLLVLAACLLLFRRRLLWGAMVASTVTMMAITEVHVRYFLQVLPLMLFGCWLGAIWLYRRLPTRWTSQVFVAICGFVLTVNLVRVAGVVLEQRQTPFVEHYKGGRYAIVPAVGKMLREHVQPNAWVLARREFARVLTYETGLNVTDPNEATGVDAGGLIRPVYILEPMDDKGRYWLSHMHQPAAKGEKIASLPGKRQDWELYRAIRAARGNETAPAPEQGSLAP